MKIKDKTITLTGYNKYWIYDKDYGHDIIINTEKGVVTIKCKWPDRKRGYQGRVSKKG
jgi:hypothetical protein